MYKGQSSNVYSRRQASTSTHALLATLKVFHSPPCTDAAKTPSFISQSRHCVSDFASHKREEKKPRLTYNRRHEYPSVYSLLSSVSCYSPGKALLPSTASQYRRKGLIFLWLTVTRHEKKGIRLQQSSKKVLKMTFPALKGMWLISM